MSKRAATMEVPYRLQRCEAKINSNTDISGVGVMSAFFFQGFIAIMIGCYMYYISGRWDRLKYFCAHVLKYVKDTGRISGLPSIPRNIYPKDPVRAAMMSDMIVLTSDVQTLSGIALMVAALSQFRSLSAYHAVMVVNMAWIPSQSHHLAIIYVWDSRPHGSHKKLRYVAIMVYVVLYTIYCTLTYVSVHKRWDLKHDCFRACISSICVGSFIERDALLSWVLVNLVLFMSCYLPILWTCFRRRFKGSSYPWLRLLEDIMFSVIGWLIATGFWTTFTLLGVIGYKKANKDLLSEDEEESWGFGQVIAVMSLLLVIFEFWKSYAKYNGVSSDDPALCHCTCFCGKRVDSFSSLESSRTMVSVNF